MAAKYDRIALDLRRRIHDGDWEPGGRLPVETELMSRYGVSLNTMRRALDVLDGEGLIEKRHGTGNFVRTQPQRLVRGNDRYQWEKDRVRLPESERRQAGAAERDTGLTVDQHVDEARYATINAPEDLARIFDVPPGTPLLQRTYRTRRVDDPASFGADTSYLVRSHVEPNPALLDMANEPWPGGSQHQFSTVGIELDRIVDEVTARPPTLEEAQELGIGPGVSVLVVRKISIDTLGRVVEIADAVFPGDRTLLRYSTPLDRWTN